MGELWNWTVAPGAAALAQAFLGREADWFPPKAPLRENRVRALALREGLFCKWYRTRADQAEAEWRALLHLTGAGLPVPRPVAWAEAPGGGAALVLEEIREAVTLKDGWRRSLAVPLANLLRGMHAAGFLHLDLHSGNVLIAGGQLHLIDVHRGRIGTVSDRDEERALGQFCYSLTRIAPVTDALRLARAYRGRRDPGYEDRVRRHADAFRRRHLASRTRRCVKESTAFAVAREADGLWILRRPATLDAARALVARHDTACAEGRALKSLDNRRIAQIDGAWVKEWPSRGPLRALQAWIRGTRARAAWIGAHGLAVRGLPAPEGIALLEGRGRALVISKAQPGKPLDRYCREDVPALRDRRPFLDALAGLIRHLHARDAVHRDLKANNILADGPTRFSFLDMEDVAFRRVRRADAIRGLAQLNAALPVLTRADRWRMLLRYAANWPLLGDLRRAAGEIMRLTVARRHNWPTPRTAPHPGPCPEGR